MLVSDIFVQSTSYTSVDNGFDNKVYIQLIVNNYRICKKTKITPDMELFLA